MHQGVAGFLSRDALVEGDALAMKWWMIGGTSSAISGQFTVLLDPTMCRYYWRSVVISGTEFF